MMLITTGGGIDPGACAWITTGGELGPAVTQFFLLVVACGGGGTWRFSPALPLELA